MLKDQRLADAAFAHVLAMDPSHHEGRVHFQSNPQMISGDPLAVAMDNYLQLTNCSRQHHSSFPANQNDIQCVHQPLVPGERFLEESVRLSSSVIWELQVITVLISLSHFIQKTFYQQHGLQAWSGSQSRRTQDMVPYYLTSNPYFGIPTLPLSSETFSQQESMRD
jgi:hypothetical protein